MFLEMLRGQRDEELKESVNIYSCPIPVGTAIRGVIGRWGPAHSVEKNGEGAFDLLVALGTPVLAPLRGEVKEIRDDNDLYGALPIYAPHANSITIQHPNGEKSKLVHLAKGSILAQPRTLVEEGQVVAYTGNSGWMTEPHLHVRVSDENGRGLLIRFKEG